MKRTLILSCLITIALVSLVGCASDERHASDDSSPTMAQDSKDMHPRHHSN